MNKNIFGRKLLALSLVCVLFLSGCSLDLAVFEQDNPIIEPTTNPAKLPPEADKSISDFNPASIPDYNGKPWIYVNNNEPFFTKSDITIESFERYSELDELNRCGVAFACLSPATQPAKHEERGNISRVSPSGWRFKGKSNNVKYDCIEGGFLYNRCHLIMWSLSAENDNPLNLITGTRYMNIDGMLPWETKANEYVDGTGNHLMYRVTPIYTGENLVADGVLMEAYSVEDNGEGLTFCVYCYNVQPGIEINYTTGESWFNGVFFDIDSSTVVYKDGADIYDDNVKTYVLNINSKKIHIGSCEFAENIADKNKREFTGRITELLEDGYTRCSSCKPN